MKQFIFSATYRGDPQEAINLLLHPKLLARSMPYVRKVDVLGEPSPGILVVSWEVEIDGVTITWREETGLVQDTNSVSFKMLKGDFRSYSGEWIISANGEETTVTLRAELDWGAPNLSRYVADIIEQKAERAFRGMVLAVARKAFHVAMEKQRVSRRFGFIFHPLDLGLLADGFGDQDLKSKRPALLEKVLTWFQPFRRGVLTGVRSPLGTEIQGDMILFPLLPEQILTLGDDFVLSRLVEAGHLAERYGDKILGLGAYVATIGRKGVFLAKQLNIPVTTGSSYTVAMAVEATLKVSQQVGIQLQEATVAIIGATGTIGRICTQLLSTEVQRLILSARNVQRLEDLAETVSGTGRAKVSVMVDLDAAVANADIIITSTSTPASIIDVKKLKPGAIVCDISRPRNISQEDALLRSDVLILDGGVVQLPGDPDFHFSFGLAPGLAYACMAETMILTLDGRYESLSIGGDISVEKVREITALGRKHGFALAGLRSFEKEISEEQIKRVRRARTRNYRARQGIAARLA